MERASSYEQWHAAALELDRLEGKERWKDDPRSPLYDHELIATRLSQMRRARETGDTASSLFLLRTSLSRNLGESGNPLLYAHTRVGTKRLIEDYHDEVVRNFNLVCDSPAPLPAKLDFFLTYSLMSRC